MLTSLLLYERIRTTKKRAQILKSMLDRTLTIGRKHRKDLAIRRINETVLDTNACRKIFEVLLPRFEGRVSGFSRIKPVGMRKGDGAMLVDILLVEGKDIVPPSEGVIKKPKSRKTSKNSSVSSTPKVSSKK